MGKKKRYIHRAEKFAKKYFKILDGFDGSADDAEIESYAAFIDTITATDNNNQTVTLTGRVLGKASDVTNNAIEYSLDGGATFTATANDTISRDAGDGGLDEFTYNSGTGANAIGIGAALPVGTNTVIVRPKGSTDTQLQKQISFTIRENKVTIGGITTAFTEAGDNIAFDASDLTISGKKAGGNNTAAALGDASNLKIKVEILRDGVAQALTGDVTSITHAIGVDFADNGGASPINDATILLADLTGVAQNTAVDYVVRITPIDATTDAALTASVAEATVTVTKD